MAPAREITARTVAEGERLAGLRYSPRQRRQVRASYGRYRTGFRDARSAGLENGEGPAGGFDPRLPGMTFETRQRPLLRSLARPPALPERDQSIAFAPVTHLSRWLKAGLLTSERLTRIYLQRLKHHDAKLHCVVTLCEEDALRSARRADREIRAGRYRGPLHGIPWGAKDLLDTKGVPTTWGAAPFRDRVPDRDATVVERLRAAGAVLLAKLTLGELAMGDVWFGGKTRSPWDRRQGSSGSSAGPAAATAAGLVGFAIGSETMGSIVSPSVRCGAVGLRPTFGRVPRTGAMALSWTMDKLGPICRAVEDAALVLDAIRGPDGEDETAVDLPFNFSAGRRVRGMRVGYAPADFRRAGTTALDRAIRGHLRDLGVEVVPVRLPEISLRALAPILMVEAASAFDGLTRSGRDAMLARQSRNAWPNAFRTARLVPAVEYVQATRMRRRLMRDIARSLDGLDAVVTPVQGWSWLVGATNYTGQPSLTLRVGMEGGHPLGMTLVGQLYDEGTLLSLGIALERRLGVRDVRPPLD